MVKWKLNGQVKKMYNDDGKDRRDKLVIAKPNNVFPNHIDLRKYCPVVVDKRKPSSKTSCMTHVVLSCLEMMMNISVVQNDVEHFFRRLKKKKSLYYNNFIKSNHSNFFIEEFLQRVTLDKRGRLTYRSLLQTLNKEGCTFRIPDETVSKYKILEYARVSFDNDNNKNGFINCLKSVLASGVPVIGTILVPPNIKREFLKSGIITTDGYSKEKLFKYSVLLVGYDDKLSFNGSKKGFFIFQNSWNKSWGEKGFGHISYRCIQKCINMDFWIISKFDFDCIDTNGYLQMYHDTDRPRCMFKIVNP